MLHVVLWGRTFRVLPSPAHSVWSTAFLEAIVEVEGINTAPYPQLLRDGDVYAEPWPRGLFWALLYVTVAIRRPHRAVWVIDTFASWLRRACHKERVAALRELHLPLGQSANNPTNRQVLRDLSRCLRVWLGLMPKEICWAQGFGMGVVGETDEEVLLWASQYPAHDNDLVATTMYLVSNVRSSHAAAMWLPVDMTALTQAVACVYGGYQPCLRAVRGHDCQEPCVLYEDSWSTFALVQTESGTLYARAHQVGMRQVQFLNSLYRLGRSLIENMNGVATPSATECPLQHVVGSTQYGPALGDQQLHVLRMIVSGHRLLVVSGAAGTGKTTLCRRIIALLARLVYGPRRRGGVLLLAPTAAAVDRLRDILVAGCGPLTLEFRTVDWVLTKATYQTSTVTRKHLRPIVVVDECGLLSGVTWARLNSVLATAGVVKHACFLGDDSQLPPIEHSEMLHPLADLMRSSHPGRNCITPCVIGVCQLTTVMRSVSGIAELGASVRSGCFALAHRCLLDHPDTITWVQNDDDVYAALVYPVLTLSHYGPLGTQQLNAHLQQVNGNNTRGLAVGDPVVATTNSKTYYNGLRGVVELLEPTSGVVTVVTQQGRRHEIPENDLRLAYCTTIHSAQGSEFDTGTVVIDSNNHQRMCTREALYTAVTRFRASLTLCCTVEGFKMCLQTTVQSAGSVVVDDFVANHVCRP